uniref:Retrotransposon protein, putative, unclassified n=2 Tax=Oryza sativa subsp. japonica TaxID=39947 RepID=Q53JT2_ORYSJ|nr:retrotransposon protein, putative, unclassified [Oryza sativa Japonica Group]ABA93097.1 retrotransposon protein, putative, unclassified [Oryza sativa Japonica Group]
MAEERESFESQWAPSDVTEENLKEMVAHGVLPAKEIIGRRAACGEAFPTPDTHEVVVFSHFFYGGFSLPTSRLFQGILDFYGISLHNLNPNSIVHIANFIHACEAFLGIRPNFALFHRIFFLKPQPNKSKPCVVGGARFQLRGTLSQKYFSMPCKTSNKGWHANWFYVQNLEPALPEYSCLPPVYQDTWNSLPMGEEAAQELALMDRMLKLKEQGLQGEQITRHFIKSRLAPIKERSRTAFEFDGKHDPNREDPESLEFKVMKERMYKIFSNAIVVSYSHLLPVVPYNAFNPPQPEFALMKSDPPIAQRRSPCRQTGQASGGPKIRSDTQSNISKSAIQLDSRKRKLVLSNDEGDDAGKSGNKEPSDIDPSGKDSEPTNVETGPSKETGPTAEDCSSDKQPATDNVEASNEPPTGNQSAQAGADANQEPPTGNQSGTEPSPIISDEEEILQIQSAEDSRPPILVKWWDDDMQPQGIIINKQKEDEEVCLLKKALGQATRIVNRIHLKNEAKTATLERLVPHLKTLEATRNQLHEAKELARKTEHDLRDRIAELQDSNFEMSGSSKVQVAKISELEKRIQALENDKAELARQRDSALKDVEDRKIKSQAQFDVLVNKIKRLEGSRDEVANTATLLVQTMFFNNNGPSTFDASEIFDKLRVAPDTYFTNIKEAGSMGASLALAMTKSLYPKIDIDAINGFADGTSEEAALDLINDAQKTADKIAVDVVERFQDNDLRPTGSDNSDEEKTDTE